MLAKAILRVTPLPAIPTQPNPSIVEWKDKKLMQAATHALKSTPNWDAAKDVIIKRVKADPELLLALLEPWLGVAIQKLLAQAAAEMRQPIKVVAPASEFRQPWAKPSSSSPPSNPSRATLAALSTVASYSLLDTFKINGKAIGDATPAEANRWAAKRECDAKFVRLLTQNLPPNEPIRKFRTAEAAVEIMEQAKQEVED